MVTGPGQPTGLPMETADGFTEWGYGFPPAVDGPAEETPTGLIDLGYLGAALRRSRRLWLTIAAAGLFIGAALFVSSKPSYQATAAILLKGDPTMDAPTQILTASEIAQEPTVAQLALKNLGLPGTRLPYTVTVIDNQVLTISLGAATSAAAVREVDAVAGAFLQIRDQAVQSLATGTINGESEQLTQDQQSVKSLDEQVNQVASEPASTAQQHQLTNLQAERSAAATALTNLQQQQADSRLIAADMLSGSRVMSTSLPTAASRKKAAIEEVGGTFFGSLFLGLAIVVIRAVLSDRLYRRDDVAVALSAPVRMSVLSGADGKRRLNVGGRDARREADLARVTECLRNCVPVSTMGHASLAIVPVDDQGFVTAALTALIELYASEGKHVAVADLAGGTLAGSLGASQPGVHVVTMNAGRAAVVLPGAGQVAPTGPRGHGSLHVASGDDIAALYSSCDIVLALATLDPAIGADHLGTWADEAVAVVTAGRSSVARVQAVGEMIRDAGVRLTAGILLGADKKDESFGLVRL